MKGDFTRNTFDRSKHYSGVRMQQGRVQLDADWNEQVDIAAHHSRATHRDVIGISGGPKGKDSQGKDLAGFKVLANQPHHPGKLLVTSGRYYVNGILCENEQAIEAPPPAGSGPRVVYLDVWERLVTALDDANIREIALGAADTATRTQVAWEVRSAALPAGTWTCERLAAWQPPEAAASPRLRAQIKRSEGQAGPCDPLTGEYRHLENQLYRVEVHKGGPRNQATFKWSRDNGSVVARWTKVDAQGRLIVSAAPQMLQALQEGKWIEVTDASYERQRKPGVMARLAQADGDALTLQAGSVQNLEHPAATSIDLTKFTDPQLRRWDSPAGPAAMVKPETQDWIELEEDIQVSFEPGTYRTGDYWLIPARTLINNILWPTESQDPAFRPPDGVTHHFCPIALVTGTGAGLNVRDCRNLFPPLTAITAEDVSYDDSTCDIGAGVQTVQDALDALCRRGGQCNIVVSREAATGDWRKLIEQIPEDKRNRLQVCFQAGDFGLAHPVTVSGQGHLRVTGCGPATRIRASQSEAALVFEGWQSVTVENLAVEAGFAGHTVAHDPKLNGALMFINCGSVTVENVSAACAEGPRRTVACISVLNPDPKPQQPTRQVVRIRGCNLTPGHGQTGILVANAGRVQVEDNVLRPAASSQGPSTPQSLLQSLFRDRDYRQAVARRLVANPQLVQLVPQPGRVGKVQFEDFSVYFETPATLTRAWHNLIQEQKPKGITDAQKLRSYLEEQVDAIISAKGMVGRAAEGNEPKWRKAFGDWYATMEKKYSDELQHGEKISDETRARLRGELLSKLRVGTWQEPDQRRSVTVTYGGFSVRFDTDPDLVSDWQKLVDTAKPTNIRKALELVDFLRNRAAQMLYQGCAAEGLAGFKNWLAAAATEHRPTADAGIVIAGAAQPDVRVMNNTLTGVLRGVHIGVSHENAARTNRDQINRAVVTGNTVEVTVTRLTAEAAHGIFGGNCQSLVVENNLVRVSRPAWMEATGIKVVGLLGPMIIIRQNHIANATTGIHVQPIAGSQTGSVQWLAGDNLTQGALFAVLAPPTVRNAGTVS
ncbi:MAG: DUF6519 domain-containing protein [Chloroflexi bacterium]|nr:DUF6519 domain-containing protein [Chloroflexota bacterium]